MYKRMHSFYLESWHMDRICKVDTHKNIYATVCMYVPGLFLCVSSNEETETKATMGHSAVCCVGPTNRNFIKI